MTAAEMTAAEITAALAEPFDPAEISWKPQSVKGNRALAIAYLNARAVMDRLDDVLGSSRWRDHYELLPNDSVKCTLSIRFDEAWDNWVTKEDVGSQSEQPDGGDRMKAAFSDALKRAAVKFGIGRYLYRLPHQWVDYDPAKRQFSADPQLPAWARPQPKKAKEPSIGEKLHKRLREKDAEFARAKLCQVGALLAAVSDAGKARGWGENLSEWGKEAVDEAAKWVRDFEARAREPEMVKKWREIVAQEPILADLNEALPNIDKLPTAEQRIIWPLVNDYAENAGWKWDATAQLFVPA